MTLDVSHDRAPAGLRPSLNNPCPQDVDHAFGPSYDTTPSLSPAAVIWTRSAIDRHASWAFPDLAANLHSFILKYLRVQLRAGMISRLSDGPAMLYGG